MCWAISDSMRMRGMQLDAAGWVDWDRHMDNIYIIGIPGIHWGRHAQTLCMRIGDATPNPPTKSGHMEIDR